MTRILMTALAGSILFPVSATFQNKAIYSIPKNNITMESVNRELIIHESQNHWILKKDLESQSTNLYFVQLAQDVSVVSELKTHGRILEYFEDEFAIWEPRNEDSLSQLSHRLHEEGGQCGTLQKLRFSALIKNQTSPEPILSSRDQKVLTMVDQVDADRILATVQTMQDWGSRYHKDEAGVLTGEKLAELYSQMIPEGRDDIVVELVDHKGSPQKSLIIKIMGTKNPEELVIVGSHLDSINNSDNTFAPGADDNASGTSTNLEMFRVLVENDIRPERTLEFHAYAAEEIGLVGSGEIAQSYKDDNKNVVAMVQFDMNGFSKNGKSKIFFVSNNTNKTLNTELGKLVDDYVGVDHGQQFLIFGSSDHASWNRLGFPVAFPTENPFAYNKKIHTKNDTTDNINAQGQMGEFAKLGLAYLMNYGGYAQDQEQ